MNKPIISLIAALSENNVIGKENKLPWHIPEDLKRFKELTRGHPIIMGRKTFESIGRVLPGRTNIVMTRETSFSMPGVIPVHSIEEALREAEEQPGSEEIFIIGGQQIFEQTLFRADRLYLTIVHTKLEGDAYFPDYKAFTKKTFEQQGESNGFSYTFLNLQKL